MTKRVFLTVFFFTALFASAMYAHAATVTLVPADDTAAFVNTNYGSVIFATSGSALASAGAAPVSINTTAMTGQAWGSNIGWIQLNGAGTPAQDVAVTCSGTTATLSGYGWGDNSSWINFGPFSGSAASSQATIDGSGNFSGYAWTENFGWLNLSALKATGSPCQTTPPPTVPPVVSGGSGGGISTSACILPYVWNAQTFSCQMPAVATLMACHDPSALNYNSQGTSDPSLCDYTSTAPLVSTGQPVASTPTLADCPYFGYSNVGSTGTNVKKIQSFLNQYIKAGLTVDGNYGQGTKKAVEDFQQLYANDILKPWFITPSTPTGWFYKTTAGIANIIVGCPAAPVYLEGPKVVHSFASFVPNASLPKVTINP